MAMSAGEGRADAAWTPPEISARGGLARWVATSTTGFRQAGAFYRKAVWSFVGLSNSVS